MSAGTFGRFPVFGKSTATAWASAILVKCNKLEIMQTIDRD